MSNLSQSEADQKRNLDAAAMELLRLLRWSMAKVLTSQQYQVFTLHWLEGMPQGDIGTEFGMYKSTVSRHYCAAIANLRTFWNIEDTYDTKIKMIDCIKNILTNHQHRVFVMHFMEGIPQKDIANKFSLSNTAVCATYNIALRKMRKYWSS